MSKERPFLPSLSHSLPLFLRSPADHRRLQSHAAVNLVPGARTLGDGGAAGGLLPGEGDPGRGTAARAATARAQPPHLPALAQPLH